MAEVAPSTAGLLDALPEPAMLANRDGAIVRANRALRRLIGDDIAERAVSEFLHDGRASFARYLGRCFGSGEPLVGTLTLAVAGEAEKFQCKGNAVRFADDTLAFLRLLPYGEARFAMLTRTVAELKDELQRRQRSEAMLREAVDERDLLLREVEHRVKNNMQLLTSLVGGAEFEADSAEAKAALRNVSLRISAVSAVQQLLYSSNSLTTIGSQALIETLTQAIPVLAVEPLDIDVTVEPVELPIETAVPIGLILNELLINALKYGRPASGKQALSVKFASYHDKISLEVQDNGPGFDPARARKRASGIGLVRGLLRQLSGSLEVEQDGGSRCLVTFAAPAAATMKATMS